MDNKKKKRLFEDIFKLGQTTIYVRNNKLIVSI